jgi:hypothetical protein
MSAKDKIHGLLRLHRVEIALMRAVPHAYYSPSNVFGDGYQMAKGHRKTRESARSCTLVRVRECALMRLVRSFLHPSPLEGTYFSQPSWMGAGRKREQLLGNEFKTKIRPTLLSCLWQGTRRPPRRGAEVATGLPPRVP